MELEAGMREFSAKQAWTSQNHVKMLTALTKDV